METHSVISYGGSIADEECCTKSICTGHATLVIIFKMSLISRSKAMWPTIYVNKKYE